MSTKLLDLVNITKSYDGVTILDVFYGILL